MFPSKITIKIYLATAKVLQTHGRQLMKPLTLKILQTNLNCHIQ